MKKSHITPITTQPYLTTPLSCNRSLPWAQRLKLPLLRLWHVWHRHATETWIRLGPWLPSHCWRSLGLEPWRLCSRRPNARGKAGTGRPKGWRAERGHCAADNAWTSMQGCRTAWGDEFFCPKNGAGRPKPGLSYVPIWTNNQSYSPVLSVCFQGLQV